MANSEIFYPQLPWLGNSNRENENDEQNIVTFYEDISAPVLLGSQKNCGGVKK